MAEDLSPVSQSHITEGDTQPLQVVLLPPYTSCTSILLTCNKNFKKIIPWEKCTTKNLIHNILIFFVSGKHVGKELRGMSLIEIEEDTRKMEKPPCL